jgi:hypothetical protein
MPAGHRVGVIGPGHSLAEVKEEAATAPRSIAPGRPRVLCLHVSDAPMRFVEVGIVGLFDVRTIPR